MNDKKSILMKAAVAGIMGVAVVSMANAQTAKGKKKGPKMEVESCYGINSCKGNGACGGADHECSGQNSCKGQGWLYVAKGSCVKIIGGSLAAPQAPAAAPAK